MKNQKLTKAAELMGKAYCSASWSAELDKEAVLKIIKEKYEHNTQNKTN